MLTTTSAPRTVQVALQAATVAAKGFRIPSRIVSTGAAARCFSSVSAKSTPLVRSMATVAPKAKAAKPAPVPAPKVDVPGFIKASLKDLAYDGDRSFLAGPTEQTTKLWEKTMVLLKEELNRNCMMDVDEKIPSTILSHPAGYIDKPLEIIVGLQTEAPLKQSIKPAGGIGIVRDALKENGRELDPKVIEIFSKYRKTHNQGVFDAYTPEMLLARKVGILTGLPDAYGRGRIIGDYRRVALYGTDGLIAAKEADKKELLSGVLNEDIIRLREEVSEQIRALKELKEMGDMYGFDLSKPAANAREAIQWTYFAYLGAIKQQDGAAMSLGRLDTFLEYYIAKDIAAGKLTESGAQELIDQFIIKLRLVRQLRPNAYKNLFAGEPQWVTLVLGGMDGTQHMVTKTSYRILQTLINLGPAPEPNLTVLWSARMPKHYRDYCSDIAIQTSSIQFENDDLMAPIHGPDYAIACCVSSMTIGKQMQFFGARCNLAKLLLYTINNGVDEVAMQKIGPEKFFGPLKSTTAKAGGVDTVALNIDEVQEKFLKAMDWLTHLYANTMNIIHFMHDKYNYESLEMALHDTHVHRFMAFGAAGISVVADSLSAIKYAKVYAIRNEKGVAIDFKVEGEYPKYGNDDDRVDTFATWSVQNFNKRLQSQYVYRNSQPTLSILTITSNVVYGKMTGTTPDLRLKGEPFAPGANPMHGRDHTGALASLSSVAKLAWSESRDGVSNTFSIVPHALGKNGGERIDNLTSLLDGYFQKKGFHLNVNVFNRDMLMDAMEHPEKYPQLTIRVSGYAVNFVRLSKDHQKEVISRTFHEKI